MTNQQLLRTRREAAQGSSWFLSRSWFSMTFTSPQLHLEIQLTLKGKKLVHCSTSDVSDVSDVSHSECLLHLHRGSVSGSMSSQEAILGSRAPQSVPSSAQLSLSLSCPPTSNPRCVPSPLTSWSWSWSDRSTSPPCCVSCPQTVLHCVQNVFRLENLVQLSP